MSKTGSHSLTSGGLLARNTIYNIIGQVAPLLASFFAIPLLIKSLGTDRYGLLTLAFIFIGYFSLFDLGLGRALTQLVAEKLGKGQNEEIPSLVWTALLLMLGLGLVGALVLAMLSPWLIYNVFKTPEALKAEVLPTFYMLAASIPVVITTAALAGILIAQQRFDLLNAVRVPMGFFTSLGPLLVLPFSQSLFPVVAVLVAGRLIAWLAHLLLCFQSMPTLHQKVSLRPKVIGTLLHFGGWMTVTNIVSPMMVYMDRFLIGSLLSVSAVAYYATPYDIVTRLLIIPGALVSVLFPAFATSLAQDKNRARLLFNRGLKYTYLALFPITLIIVTLAYEGLNFWLGDEFAKNSTPILQWLAIGVLINSLAQAPSTLLQAAGRPDINAKLHFIELPFYLFSVWYLIGAYGIHGAAIAWVFRVAVDALFLFSMVQRVLPSNALTTYPVLITMGVSLLSLVLATFWIGIFAKGLFLVLALFAFALITWFLILASEERVMLRNRLKLFHLLS